MGQRYNSAQFTGNDVAKHAAAVAVASSKQIARQSTHKASWLQHKQSSWLLNVTALTFYPGNYCIPQQQRTLLAIGQNLHM